MWDLIKQRKAQATAELAILGSIVIMLLAYLLQQGFMFNSRQALEMYTFREALRLSRGENRGISLTVMRDVITPSFFMGINRQRLTATASVEYNPYKLWLPYYEEEESPNDVPSRQLLQIGEAMIRKGLFFEIPPTRIIMKTTESEDGPTPTWVASTVTQTEPTNKIIQSTYNYRTTVSEDTLGKTITKNLSSQDTLLPTAEITFEVAPRIVENYTKDDWEGKIESVVVDGSTIPADATLVQEETIRKTKFTQTPH